MTGSWQFGVLPRLPTETMRSEVAILKQVVADFLRMKTDSATELQVGQSCFAEIEDGFDADPKKVSYLFRRPKCIACRGLRMVHGRS